MDWIKEVIEASNARIKSPVLGSVIFAFLAANWKPLFYLGFANATVVEKFAYFDANTTWLRLLWFPIGVGVLLSFCNPWIRLFALKLTQKPIQEAKMLQLALANERLTKKQELEEARRSLLASREEELIAAAKRDQEILAIENSELRDQLRNTINENREKFSTSPVIHPKDSKNSYEIELKRLKELLEFYEERRDSAYQQGDETRGDSNHEKIISVEDQIEKLAERTFNENMNRL